MTADMHETKDAPGDQLDHGPMDMPVPRYHGVTGSGRWSAPRGWFVRHRLGVMLEACHQARASPFRGRGRDDPCCDPTRGDAVCGRTDGFEKRVAPSIREIRNEHLIHLA